MVREMVKEAVHKHMVNELDRLNLKELGGVIGTQGTSSTQSTTGTSGTAETTNTTGTKPSQPGNKDIANNVLVPGSNLNINQGLQMAAKDPNFKKKADLIQKISNQISGMKGVVVKEDPSDEPDLSITGGKRLNTREPMFLDLVNRISNLVYYGDKSDEEILADLGPMVSSNEKMTRWVKFIANMVRKGKDVLEESA